MTSKRTGFTLVELLVVIAIIMILAGIAAAFLPVIGDSDRAARGGTMLQQWILTAKQKALRDQVPTGIRLSATPYTDTNGTVVTTQVLSCQYIEQPDDFTATPPPQGSPADMGSLSGTQGQNSVTISGMDITKQVAAGDRLELLGNGLMYTITSSQFTAPNSTLLTLDAQLVYSVSSPVLATGQNRYPNSYRILRAPRITGDELLQLPDGVVIDLQTNANYSPAFGGNLPAVNPDKISYDILFAPSGAVISPGVTSDTINLWVREQSSSVANTADGNQTIIAIYARSGLTAAHPPASTGPDPYRFIKDGRTSGK
jgi:prepilin-type N-terminal cleavage/methylation domain-containing protein